MNDVTQILQQIEDGDSSAAEHLLPLVYNELRKLAAARMAHERPDHTLPPTALVHEAYVRLVDHNHPQHWDTRGHFFAAAAEAMRRILINRARDRQRTVEGARSPRIDLDQIEFAEHTPPDELVALDQALSELSAEDPVSADLVKLRFFAGMTQGEAAAALALPRRTADRYWAYARAWLYDRLRGLEVAR